MQIKKEFFEELEAEIKKFSPHKKIQICKGIGNLLMLKIGIG